MSDNKVFFMDENNCPFKESRLKLLNNILQFCYDKGGWFTTGERICINQERAKLIANNTENFEDGFLFPHSELLQTKIKVLKNKMIQLQYKPIEEIEINFK